MRICDFKLGQRWVSNEWAIKLIRTTKWYEVYFVLEEWATKDNIKFWDDPVVNMNLEMFIQMFDNPSFIGFKEQWWSVLKASDCNNYVLDNLAEVKDLSYSETKNFLWMLKLGKPRPIDLDKIKQYEKDKDWEQSSVE